MIHKIVGWRELQKRCTLLSPIDDNLDAQSIIKRYNEEEIKLIHNDDELILLAHSTDSIYPYQGMKFYRITSKFDGFDKTQPNNFRNPPPPYAPAGRCNLPKYPVFYCSTNGFFSLREYLKYHPITETTELFLSEWIITRTHLWRMLSFIFSEIPSENPFHIIGKERHFDVVRLYSQWMTTKQIDEYIKFYHQKFTSDDHLFSSLMAHKFFYGDQEDLIIYPSVVNDKKDCNYAFNVKTINDRLLQLNKIYAFMISNFKQDANEFNINWSLEEVSTQINHHKIHWQEKHVVDVKEFIKAMRLQTYNVKHTLQ